MGTEQETQKDLSLDPNAGEEVVGGRSVKHHSKTTKHHVTYKVVPEPYGQAPSTLPGPNTYTPGDPDY